MRRTDDRVDIGFGSDPGSDVIFSLTDGYVWASSPGTTVAVKLGSEVGVVAMMEDFLAQCALGEHLANRNAGASE